MLPAMFFLGLVSIGTATSKNAAVIFITRFLGGVFGSAPVSNVSAALGDIWVPSERGLAVILYSIAVTGGPTIGPIIGAALIASPSLGWRWTEYIEAIWVFTTVAVCFFCLPESYSPVLLARRAKKLRADGAVDYYHLHEQLKLDFKTIITKHFTRPLLMLATEPIVTCVAFYASFVYGILYLTLELFRKAGAQSLWIENHVFCRAQRKPRPTKYLTSATPSLQVIRTSSNISKSSES
jgi:MFS family permease